jgi:hypothetical protein
MKWFQLALLWLQIRSLEVTAHGQEMAMGAVISIPDWQHIKCRHAELLAEISRLKSEYRRIQRGDGLRAWRATS